MQRLTPAPAYRPTYRWLYNNRLTRVPPELGQLSQLKRLWLDRNRLECLPEGMLERMGQLQARRRRPVLYRVVPRCAVLLLALCCAVG